MARNTRQRSAVLDALITTRRALTALELCAIAQKDVPGLSLATVYRRLKDLQDESVAQRVELPGLVTRYEAVSLPEPGDAAAIDHHHHFHCKGCEQVFPIHACPGPMKQIAPKGFRVESHEITLHGRCPACGPARAVR